MSKISPNSPCPCHSGIKYKKCCRPYHQGAWPKTALALMRSRYCAYVLGLGKYIIDTTHPDNPQYEEDIAAWEASIDSFAQGTRFEALEILEDEEGEQEAYVDFRALLNSEWMQERSRFLKVGGRWLYRDGDVSRGGNKEAEASALNSAKL